MGTGEPTAAAAVVNAAMAGHLIKVSLKRNFRTLFYYPNQ